MKPRVLVAVDGSEMSKRAVRHVGNIICRCKEFEVTLYHVISVPPALLEQGGAENPDEERKLEEELRDAKQRWIMETSERINREIFSPAEEILGKTGEVEDVSVVKTKIEYDPHSDVAGTIVSETKNGGYDVVVLGRRGESTLKEFMMGSVVHKVVHQAEGCAVWVVQ
jgi:nucleotide-binding universal stress UspA family protein